MPAYRELDSTWQWQKLARAGQGAAAAPRTISAGEGGVLNVLETGLVGEETVVFLHGFGGDLSTWLFNQPGSMADATSIERQMSNL